MHMASSMTMMRRHRRGIAEEEVEVEDYDEDGGGSGTLPDDDTTDTGTDEEEEEEDPRRLHLGLHSMTAKGIQHLCSELLEIKKASEQDLRANVYLSYLSFIRMFHEAGDLDKDVHRLKRQVIGHRRLIQHLSSSLLWSSSASHSPPGTRTTPHYYSNKDDDEVELEVLVSEQALEVLVSEHRMEQALELVLQQQGKQKQGQQQQRRVAERLASVAGNPRTPRAELLRALSGLCKLGEAERANRLLFSWHRARLVLVPVSHINDLARTVLSSIAAASRSLVALHGEHHPYTPQLLRWAREDMVEDLLPVYTRHLKEVVRLLVASDGEQALGRFRAPAPAPAPAVLLTASGRKLVTLLQEAVHDVACPLQRLGMDSAAVQLVADLFGEYLSSVLLLLLNPNNPNNNNNNNPNNTMRQVSVLINCTTLVSLLPAIWPSAPAQAQARVGSLIKEAAAQVWSAFCHQFIQDFRQQVPEEGTLPLPLLEGQQAPSVSVCLQVVFLRVRRLEEAYGAILGGDDGTMRKLLQELMEAIISWLSTNPPESWTATTDNKGAQAQLDVYFLLEIARLGGFDVTATALGLLAEIDDGDHRSHCAAWAADAANHAVQVLLRHNICPQHQETHAAEESESSNDMPSSNSTDDFVSIDDEDEQDKPIQGSDQEAAPQQHSENGIHDDSSRPAAADKEAPRGRGRGTKKKAPVSTSSRPRWQ